MPAHESWVYTRKRGLASDPWIRWQRASTCILGLHQEERPRFRSVNQVAARQHVHLGSTPGREASLPIRESGGSAPARASWVYTRKRGLASDP
ncbi:hypothetical protein NDU88_009420 [Pleurodeles waltl]|uniref:Uncharacterized protein n=1 Tax=Pleurodeles waltl TaxID=8319 RepID=A0AAV7P254_PLEWA|nr:hypothetical protein NDU88_009420 [Pleurodeles waltl]